MHRTESLRNRAGGGGEGKKDNTRMSRVKSDQDISSSASSSLNSTTTRSPRKGAGPLRNRAKSGETHMCREEEETVAKMEDALVKARSEVEDKRNLIDHFHREMLKMQQVFSKLLARDRERKQRKSPPKDSDQGLEERQRRDLDARMEYLKNGPFNVVFHNMQPDWIEEEMADDIDFKQDVLELRVKNMLKTEVGMIRDIPLLNVFRYTDGPRIGNAAPVVVTFKNRKDKEQLIWRCKEKLKKAGILVTEDSQARLARDREVQTDGRKGRERAAKRAVKMKRETEEEEEERLTREMEAWFD